MAEASRVPRDELAVILIENAYEVAERCLRCDAPVLLTTTTVFSLLELVEAAEAHAKECHG